MADLLLRSQLPIVAAPMAGGPSTVALAQAVASAGGFPFLAGGYKSATSLAEEIGQVRGGGSDFGVNLFVPPAERAQEVVAAYAAELADEAAALGLELESNALSEADVTDRWDEKISLLLSQPVPVVSLAFGLPDPGVITALQQAGTKVVATVTDAGEARQASDAGVDGLVVQGPAAGGHSATFDPRRTVTELATAELVRAVGAVVDLPLVAAGGVDGPAAVRDQLDAGAQSVAVGTMLLRTDEAGTSPTHKRALADPTFTETVLTRAFTGRPARALRNGFIDRHQGTAPTAYPEVHHLTRPLRQAASRAGDADRLHLWAGTGWRHAPTGAAVAVIAGLATAL